MLSALPHGPLAPHFAGPFAVLKQTARNAFQLDLPETARRAHVQPKSHTCPKIDSLKSYADSLGNWDEPSGLDNVKPGTDQPPLPHDEAQRVSSTPRAHRLACPHRSFLADPRARKTLLRQYRESAEKGVDRIRIHHDGGARLALGPVVLVLVRTLPSFCPLLQPPAPVPNRGEPPHAARLRGLVSTVENQAAFQRTTARRGTRYTSTFPAPHPGVHTALNQITGNINL